MDARGPLSPLVVALVLAGTPAWADADHERARAAREAGKIVAFQTILDRVQAEFPGTVLEVELQEDDGRWIYKVELLGLCRGLLGVARFDVSEGPRDVVPRLQGIDEFYEPALRAEPVEQERGRHDGEGVRMLSRRQQLRHPRLVESEPHHGGHVGVDSVVTAVRSTRHRAPGARAPRPGPSSRG